MYCAFTRYTSLQWPSAVQGASAPWIHTDEGDDDMPGHVKCSMFGASLNIPITKGKLNLGTWQVKHAC